MATEVWIFVLMATKGWNYVTNGDTKKMDCVLMSTKRGIFVRMAIKKCIFVRIATNGWIFVPIAKKNGFCTNGEKSTDFCTMTRGACLPPSRPGQGQEITQDSLQEAQRVTYQNPHCHIIVPIPAARCLCGQRTFREIRELLQFCLSEHLRRLFIILKICVFCIFILFHFIYVHIKKLYRDYF